MSVTFSPSVLGRYKSNLHVNIGSGQQKRFVPFPPGSKDEKYDKYYFQIIVFDRNTSDSERKWDPPKLVYGTKKDIMTFFNLEEGIDNQQYILPTIGVEVDQEFMHAGLNTKGKIAAEYSSVRYMLQCRRISQAIALTWIDKDTWTNKENIGGYTLDQVDLLSDIFDSYNILPQTYFLNPPDWLNLPRSEDSKNNEDYQLAEISPFKLEEAIYHVTHENKSEDADLMSYIKRPSSNGYDCIKLSLLLSGQTYYEDENGKYQLVFDSIISTYEMVWEYGFALTWDSYYATRIDIAQAGGCPNPPYYALTMPYPPRPSEYSLEQKEIKVWATASEFSNPDDRDADDHADPNRFPFYPVKNSEKWDNQQLEYVAPPFPYIPLSTS